MNNKNEKIIEKLSELLNNKEVRCHRRKKITDISLKEVWECIEV